MSQVRQLGRPFACNQPFYQANRQLRLRKAAVCRAEPQEHFNFKGCDTALSSCIKVVGCGGCCVDYLAAVAAYPKPDEKLRSESLEVQGGGNCANAVTAAARLGLSPAILTKIGTDGVGDGIISELQADGVDTQFILRDAGSPSPFTYVIVDRAGGTRTCIHTPGAPLHPDELSKELMNNLLKDAELVYFDGRLTEAAVKLAARAQQLGIRVLVEAERLRPGLDQLLLLADYVVTSANFPQAWTGEKLLSDALVGTALRLPRAMVIITTLGKKGSVMLRRSAASFMPGGAEAPAGAAKPLEDDLSRFFARLEAEPRRDGSPPDCVSANGVPIRAPPVVGAGGWYTYTANRDVAAAGEAARLEANRAAAMNGEQGRGDGYAIALKEQAPTLGAQLFVAGAASIDQDAIVDTTGAGDSFIGAIIYGLVQHRSDAEVLKLAATVAACKCTALGARAGQPRRQNLTGELLQENVMQHDPHLARRRDWNQPQPYTELGASTHPGS